VEGENLKQLLERTGPFPLERALVFAIEIGRGLAFAHEHGLVHRDVKPQNVLVAVDGGVKVTDFGIARSAGLAELTLAGTVVGTSDYIAPEQANGQQASERSDIYSLGIVLFELLTGEVPFRGDGFIEVALRHLTEPAPDLLGPRPELPPRLAAAVARALEKDPDRRYQSMSQFVDELTACLEAAEAHDTTLVVPAAPSREPKRRQPRTLPAKAITGSVIVLAATGASYLVLGTHARKPLAPGQTIAAAIRLRAVAAYDPPPGDGVEDNPRLSLATDGNPTTYWATEWYTNAHFGNLKSGVGIVLDAGKPVHLATLTVQSDTPGFVATIKAGHSRTGPFQPVTPTQTIARRTTFRLRPGPASEYYLLWITELSPTTGPNYQAHINEVNAN